MNNLRLTWASITKHLKQVVFQNTVSLVNIIFFAVTVLLVLFGEFQEALFLGVVLFLNVVIGIVQDLRAKIALEQLQILMTPKITRIRGGAEQSITLEEVSIGDVLKINLGDQIPADGRLVESFGLEINEALLTGESNNRGKLQNDSVLAGSFVTAGSGLLEVGLLPKESFVSKMTDKIKQYTANLSPIQHTLNTFIKFMSFILLAVVGYVLFHGLTGHEILLSIVKDIAALTGTLIPQGLILATTVFFAYGAVRMFRKNVLLQEINATEKLGRIKNLCIDKTGTLTENTPVLDDVSLFGNTSRGGISEILTGYIQANRDQSETTKAIQAVWKGVFTGRAGNALPFSSTRKYGAAQLTIRGITSTYVLGAPDILRSAFSSDEEKMWLDELMQEYAPKAKRLVLLAEGNMAGVPQTLDGIVLRPLALFILSNPLRSGTKEIIDFFQNRGVNIRVISGDNPQTVQAIATEAGIHYTDMIVTGAELDRWDETAFEERVPAYRLFARIRPEQKEKIIAVLKKNGFTAMVGDGANDALAIKKSDLGVAMMNGAGATRQIAQIVLMDNSFAALPVGVNLAETIITNIELVASIFFNKVAVGLFLFVALASLGYTYPLSPRNTTIINYFIIGLPMVFWALFPAHKEKSTDEKSFWRKVLPFSLVMGLLTTLAAVLVFLIEPVTFRHGGSNILLVFVLTAQGFWFFVLAPMAYGLTINQRDRKMLYAFAAAGLAFLVFVILQPAWSKFFDLRRPPLLLTFFTLCIIYIFGWLQYHITLKWFKS